MTDKIVIFSTCESIDDAKRVAGRLVDLRLAACVNIMPGATSVYRWKGAIESASEVMLIIKTRLELVKQIEEEFAQSHPYEVPELIAVPIVAGSAAYLGWLEKETSERGPDSFTM